MCIHSHLLWMHNKKNSRMCKNCAFGHPIDLFEKFLFARDSGDALRRNLTAIHEERQEQPRLPAQHSQLTADQWI